MLICLEHVVRVFDQNHLVIDHVSASFPDHGLVLIQGENGTGKSTLLNLLGMMDSSFEGSYQYDGKDVSALSDSEKARIRREEISYVFQKDNLLSFLNCGENEGLYDSLDGKHVATDNATKWHKLSHGQQEYLVLKRELKLGKRLYLLDEVLSSLDTKHREEIIHIIKTLSKSSLVILVSHDVSVLGFCDAVYVLKKGKLTKKRDNPKEDDDNAFAENTKKEERNPKKNHIHSLLFRDYIHDWFFHLLRVMVLSLVFGIGFLGVSVSKPDSVYSLSKAMQKEDTLLLETNHRFGKEEVERVFPYSYEYVPMSLFVGIDDHVPFGKVAMSSRTKHDQEIKEQYTLKVNGNYAGRNEVTLPVYVDDSVPYSVYLISRETATVYPLSPSEQCITLSKEDFYTTQHPQYHYYVQKQSLNSFSFEPLSSLNDGSSLAEDTFYTSSSFLISDNHLDFAEPRYDSDTEAEKLNLKEIFPDGVEIKTFLHEGDKDLIYVSPNTYRRISESYHRLASLYLIPLERHRTDSLWKLSYHHLRCEYSCFLTRHPDSAYLEKYNASLGNRDIDTSYGLLPYISFLVFASIEVLSVSFVCLIKTKDDTFLKNAGLNQKERRRFLLIPLWMDVMMSVLIGLLLGFLLLYLPYQIGYDLCFIFGVPWFVLMLLLSYLLERLVLRRRMGK